MWPGGLWSEPRKGAPGPGPFLPARHWGGWQERVRSEGGEWNREGVDWLRRHAAPRPPEGSGGRGLSWRAQYPAAERETAPGVCGCHFPAPDRLVVGPRQGDPQGFPKFLAKKRDRKKIFFSFGCPQRGRGVTNLKMESVPNSCVYFVSDDQNFFLQKEQLFFTLITETVKSLATF